MSLPRQGLMIAAVAATVSFGCSSFREMYLFRAGRPGAANYYRVQIKGRTFFSSSQFAAGLYDAEAVDALFGELTGPGKKVTISSVAFQTSGGGDSTTTTAAATTVATSGSPSDLALVSGADSASKNGAASQTVGGKTLGNQKFVFFLSSNANAFVNQIQTYVSADRMQTAVMTLIFKDDLQKLEASRSQATTSDFRAKALADAIKSATASLGTGDQANSGDVKVSALSVLAVLAARSNTSSPPVFDNFDAAAKWLRDHPRAFRTGQGSGL